MIEWNKIFRYDEGSPTCIKWVDEYRKGINGKPVRRISMNAGFLTSEGGLAIQYEGKVYTISKIIWEMFNGKIPEGRNVIYVDGDKSNCKISNLELNYVISDNEYKYGEYLSKFFVYDEDSPSGLRWNSVYNKGSNIKIGDVAGSNDEGYWRIHALGRNLKAYKIVWALHNDFKDQSGMHIDHIDGNSLNNKIENLRLVPIEVNARNKPMLKNNTSGVHGVCFQTVKTKAGNYVDRYVAYWRSIDGRQMSKCFSVNKYGEELARFLAEEYRLHQIDLLNLVGAGYTDRHGK